MSFQENASVFLKGIRHAPSVCRQESALAVRRRDVPTEIARSHLASLSVSVKAYGKYSCHRIPGKPNHSDPDDPSGQPDAFVLRTLVEPRLTSTLCLAVSAHKPATPLTKHVLRLLRELILAAAKTVPPTPPDRIHNKTR
ncbi:MAG: hypothetical protein Q8M11_14325 [Sulfuritalea sp.]|nr:hypothetical protein [Sulfuritalea sp.]MDP1984072.1 hypothetical protein [Sulfuritalea sp.]